MNAEPKKKSNLAKRVSIPDPVIVILDSRRKVRIEKFVNRGHREQTITIEGLGGKINFLKTIHYGDRVDSGKNIIRKKRLV